jgi:filamentous hemagglutinin family protein
LKNLATICGLPGVSSCAWLRALGVSLAGLAAAPAAAEPQGGVVIAGDAIVLGGGASVSIEQASDRAIIRWDGFDIDLGGRVEFNQPSAGAIALNRVTGGTRSQIDGELTANGRVWIVNPNGVAFGPTAQVDVGGLLATTADIADADFMAGRYDFSVPSGLADAAVTNDGAITVADAGLAALVAPQVRNSGTIDGQMAQVVLAGASTFTVDFAGDGLIAFDITGQVADLPDGAGEAVLNDGTLRVPGGTVRVTAAVLDGVVDNAITMGGVVEARSVSVEGGRIVLSGSIDAAGGAGGTVALNGDALDLRTGAAVDAGGGALRLEAAGDILSAAPAGALQAGSVEIAAGGSAGSAGMPLPLGGAIETVTLAVADHAFLDIADTGRADLVGSVGGDLAAAVEGSAGVGHGGAELRVGGLFDLSAGGSIGQGGPLIASVLSGSAGADLRLDAAGNEIGQIGSFQTGLASGRAGGFVLFDGAGGLALGSVFAEGGGIDISTDDALDMRGRVVSSGGAIALASRSGGIVFSGAVVDAGPGSIALAAAGDIAGPGRIVRAAGIELVAAGDVGGAGQPLVVETVGSVVQLDVGGDAVLDIVRTDDTAVTGRVGGDAVIAAADDLQIGHGGTGLTVVDSLHLVSAGSIGQAGPLATALLSGSAGGHVALGDPANAVARLDGFATGTGPGEPGGFVLADGEGGLEVTGRLTAGRGAIALSTRDRLTVGSEISSPGGAISLTSAAGEILLRDGVDAGTGTIALSSGTDILRSAGALIAADLTLDAASDAGAPGSPLQYRPTGSAVALSTAGSVFLDILGGQTVTLFGSAGGTAAIGAGGPVRIGDGGTGLTVGQAFDLRSGSVSQAAGPGLAVGGAALFDPNGGSVLLAGPFNDFGGPVSIIAANTASLADLDDLVLGPIGVTGTFAARAGGSIAQTGRLDTGPFWVAAGGDALLSDFANRVGPFAASVGGTLAFDHFGSLVVGSVQPAGGLAPLSGLEAGFASLRMPGSLTQTAAVRTGGLAVRSGGSAELTLSGNDFGTVAILSGGALRLTDGSGGFAVGTVPAAGELAALTGATAGGAANLAALGSGATLVVAPGARIFAPAGPIDVRADDIALVGAIEAPGQTVTLGPGTPGRTIALGGEGAIGDFRLGGGELQSIAAATLRIGNPEAGQITFGQIDAASVAGFATLDLATAQGIDFRGEINGDLNFTLAPGPGSDGNIAFAAAVGAQEPLGEIVFAFGNDVAIADVFRARRILVQDVSGTVRNVDLSPGSDTPTGISVDSLEIVGGRPSAVAFFGEVGGIGGEQAALVARAFPRDNDYQINGCVIGDLTSCIDFGVDVPSQVLNLDLSNRRLFLPGRRGRRDQSDILFSNTGNEELW